MDQEYQKPNFFERWKKVSKTQKLKNVKKYAKISDTPFDQRSLIHREGWFLYGPRIPKNPNCLKNGKNHPKCKNSNMSRNIPKLAILPSTRGPLSIGKCCFHLVFSEMRHLHLTHVSTKIIDNTHDNENTIMVMHTRPTFQSHASRSTVPE